MDRRDWMNLPLVEEIDNSMSCMIAPQPCARLMAMVPQVAETIRKQYHTASPDALACVKARLWLLADDLGTCHKICQNIATPLGSAWHAIMHRREGDFFNSLYWWRRVGVIRWLHPREGTDIAECIDQITGAGNLWRRASLKLVHPYDPAIFTRIVEACTPAKSTESADVLMRIGRLEWLALFAMSMAAVGAVGTEDRSRRAPAGS